MLRARLRTTPRVVMKVSTDEKDSQLLSAVGICPSYPLQGKGTILSSSKMAGKGQRDLRGSQAHKAKGSAQFSGNQSAGNQAGKQLPKVSACSR